MRTPPPYLRALWERGGPFIGPDRYNGIVTVEPDWWLNVAGSNRWFLRADQTQVELEVPNVLTIDTNGSIDADAAECTVTILNQKMDANTGGQLVRLGDPGHYTPYRPDTPESRARWGSMVNEWNGILNEGALLRTYEGFGGHDKTRAQALADGNIMLTGVWFVDDVAPSPEGDLRIKCRDAASLLIDQQLRPPLVPPEWWGVRFCRWKDVTRIAPAVPVYDAVTPIENGADGFPKWINDVTLSPDGKGYWLLGSDGGVFTYGHALFWGSMGAGGLTAPAAGIEATPSGMGYWMVCEDGTVHTFGDAVHYGDARNKVLVQPIRRIRRHPSGRGYWLMAEDGGVFSYGEARFHGARPPLNPGDYIVDMTVSPSGAGYRLLSSDGGVFCFGDSPFKGRANPEPGRDCVGMIRTPSDLGYWIVDDIGTRHHCGDAPVTDENGDFAGIQATLNDPIFAITPMPTGLGYLLVGGDGGIFSFGDAPFYGSLLAPHPFTVRYDGNYLDFVDIVKLICGWSGFWLGPDDGLYGNFESTGTYGEECLDPTLFHSRPPIEPITELRQIVGYIFRVDAEGAPHFESPNWWEPGNWINGVRTSDIPVLDEKWNLTRYEPLLTRKTARSEIIISSSDPLVNLPGTITTRLEPQWAKSILRGRVNPAGWTNGYFIAAEVQAAMAKLASMHLYFGARTGSCSAIAAGWLEIDDQVWIHERVSGEDAIHYIRGKSTSGNRETGTYMMTLNTHRLGDADGWDSEVL